MKKYFMFLFTCNVMLLHAQYDDPYQYYPLAKGNYWYYSAGPDYYYSEKVYADSTDGVGNSFFWMYDRSNYPNFPPTYMLDTNYNLDGGSTILLRLNASLGEKWWIVTGADGDTTIGKYGELSTISDGYYLGVGTRLKKYTFYNRVKQGNEYHDYYDHIETFAYGIGKVYVDNDSNYPYVLIGAIIDGKTIGNPVGVEETAFYELPGNFELFQNYPNPFNPNTTIKFQLPISGNVKLSIFNMLGEKVVDFLDAYLNEGIHQIAVDFSKYHLSSGAYLYVINYKNQKMHKKMLYLK